MSEQTEVIKQTTAHAPVNQHDAASVVPSGGAASSALTAPSGKCETCGGIRRSHGVGPNGPGLPSYVYAIGRIEARFPNLSAEKEFSQATARTETAGKTDQQTFYTILSKRENRYLVRQLCWVMSIQGMDSYLLLPRDPADIDLLVDAIRPTPSPSDVDVVIGMRGPIAPPSMCNGLMVPIVIFDQIYSFNRDTLLKAIPKPQDAPAAEFSHAAEELFDRIMQLTDNAGAIDEHRALNYLVMRYPAIYAKASEEFARDHSLTGVEVRQSPLGVSRKIVDVIFAYTNRNTDFTEKFYVRVDVTEEFPFLVTKMGPYYDREIGG